MSELKKYKSVYFTYDFYEGQLSFFWTERANNITEHNFFFTVKKVAAIVELYKPDKIFVDFYHVSVVLDSINQFQVIKFVAPSFIQAQVHKLAVFVGEKDVIKSMFISQLLEKESRLIKFSAKTFHNKIRAIEWLNQ